MDILLRKEKFMILISWIKRRIFMYKLNRNYPLPENWNDSDDGFVENQN